MRGAVIVAAPEILVVEDDEAIATGLALNLKIAGYRPHVVHDGEKALEAARAGTASLILLDLNLPRRDGLEVLSEIRTSGDRTPIIVLSAREDEFDKVAALRLGADDYVTKPFSLAELLARVDAVLRRASNTAPAASALRRGDLHVEIETRTVSRRGQVVKLTHLEFELLAFFVGHPSRVFTRREILAQVWEQRSGSPRTVDNFVAQLRAKLEDDPDQPIHLVTVRGSGYRFDP